MEGPEFNPQYQPQKKKRRAYNILHTSEDVRYGKG
jgi:hypothetical protein